MTIEETNNLVLERLSQYLNNASRFITEDMVNEMVDDFSMDRESAFRFLLAGALDLSENREICDRYLFKSVHMLDPEVYRRDPYYRDIVFPLNIKEKNWQLKLELYEPYEGFVFNDLETDSDGRILPQIGFFPERYSYPCVLQNGREWMTITPNEVETMRQPIAEASGHVMTFGLGLGYYAYMTARKEEVTDVTVVEKDPEVIRLFEKYILPQLDCRDKIRIVNEDALVVAEKLKSRRWDQSEHKPDYVFADLWHDPSDGVPLYRQLRNMERPDIRYSYWIEKTMLFYM